MEKIHVYTTCLSCYQRHSVNIGAGIQQIQTATTLYYNIITQHRQILLVLLYQFADNLFVKYQSIYCIHAAGVYYS